MEEPKLWKRRQKSRRRPSTATHVVLIAPDVDFTTPSTNQPQQVQIQTKSNTICVQIVTSRRECQVRIGLLTLSNLRSQNTRRSPTRTPLGPILKRYCYWRGWRTLTIIGPKLP